MGKSAESQASGRIHLDRADLDSRVELVDVPDRILLERFYSGQEAHARAAVFRKLAAVDVLPPGIPLVRSHVGSDFESFLCVGPDHMVAVRSNAVSTRLRVTASDASVADRVLAEITSRIPPMAEDVEVGFWHHVEGQGPRCVQRWLVLPEWADVRRNYPQEVAGPVDRLMGLRPSAGGRLILWHGEPGTGKTSAIRSLIRSWAPWCDSHVISDPEQFFGRADYMLQALSTDRPTSLFVKADSDLMPAERWRLIICEDADDYIRSDARRRSGWALTRLLNLTDGLLGQGLRALVLVTTNEDLGRLHPAVLRAGRCLAEVEFRRFTAPEARDWLGTEMVSGPKTLAELYELRGDTARIGESKTSALLPTGTYL